MQYVALAHIKLPAGIGAPPEILGVRTAHALRRTGGARRVEDREQIAGAGVRGGRFGAEGRQGFDRYRVPPLTHSAVIPRESGESSNPLRWGY